ncbi:MmgE/PrpD family protein [Acidocella sp.]|uniref:MmgE/PrpD family protein n=1 Tax=Acidocella sp. TaxID=50710 RepID=UPI00261C6B3B|nr:MmgE/PrpD family protein [Acidocella sp.]
MDMLSDAQPGTEAQAGQRRLVSQELAAFTHDLAFAALPEAVTRRAAHLILDGTGIALASTGFDFAQRTLTAMRGLAGPGEAAVIGFPDRLPMRDAAVVNGLLIHGLDYDDTHMRGVIHATASLWPTVLAVGARQRASGREALTAYVAGMEVAGRLGAVAKGGFHQVGFHPTGLIGAFACALAAGKLMELTAAQLTLAQGIVLSLGAGSMEFLEDGAWNKRLHPGWAANAGITAAALARQGFEGAKRAYEGRFGLYASHLQAHYEPEALALATQGLGSVWEIMDVGVKPFPACHFTHACADAAIALRAAGLDPARIRRVRALIPAEVVKTVCEPVANKRRPANAYDAQFSIPFIVAAALLRGRFSLNELSAEAITDPAILALADRVDYEIDPGSGFPAYYSGEVIVEMEDGTTRRQREHRNRGCGERPLSDEDILAKYRDNAARAASAARVERIRAAILDLAAAGDLREIDDLLGLK